MAEPELLTVEDASRLLAVGRSTLYQWIAEGLVPTFRLHGVVRIPRSALIRMVETQTEGLIASATSIEERARSTPVVEGPDVRDQTRSAPASNSGDER